MEPAKIETLCRKLEDGTTEGVAPRTVVEALSGTGTKGQVIGFTADNTIGVVSVGAGGTAADSVPTSRTINGYPLTEDIALTAEDVGAAKTDHSHETITGTLPIGNGGTGAATAEAALTALGAAASTHKHTATDVGAAAATHQHAATDITGTLAVANGGTGATTATAALTNLGAAASNHSHAATTLTGILPVANGGTGAGNATAGLAALGGAQKATSVTISISASWSGNTQSVECNGVVADETAQEIHIMPKSTSVAAYVSAGVYCSGQAANQLTFTCVTVPTAKLDVYVNIWPLK